MNEIAQKEPELLFKNEIQIFKIAKENCSGFETFIRLPTLCTFSTCISEYISDTHIKTYTYCIGIISKRWKRKGSTSKSVL